MAKTNIEWTDLTNMFGHQDPVEKEVARLDLSSVQPFPDIEMSFAAVTRPACGNEVTVSTMPVFLHGDDVINRIGRLATVRTFSVEHSVNENFLLSRGGRTSSFSICSRSSHQIAKLRTPFIETSPVSINARTTATLLQVRSGELLPLMAPTAPSQVISLHCFTNDAARGFRRSAKPTRSCQVVVTGWIPTKELAGPPERALPAAFKAHFRPFNIRFERNSGSSSGDFQNPKIASHSYILTNRRTNPWV